MITSFISVEFLVFVITTVGVIFVAMAYKLGKISAKIEEIEREIKDITAMEEETRSLVDGLMMRTREWIGR